MTVRTRRRQIKTMVFVCLFLFQIFSGTLQQIYGLDPGELCARAALLMDADSGRVLYEKNGDQKMPMASTTKIMTCLLALELGKTDAIVEFSAKAAGSPKVHLGVSKGTKFYLGDLLYSLMLESHNDTAVAIAEHLAGSELAFANLMNQRAKKIGASNTNFVTSNGLDAETHYTTARDLALIAREAIRNETFMEIINTASHSFQDVEGKYRFQVNNKNAFLNMMDGACGIKTGFTGNAGYCFVGCVKQNNKTLISVVLGSGWPPNKTYKWQDTKKLMDYGMKHFEYRVLFQGIPEYQKFALEHGIQDDFQTYISGYSSTLVGNLDQVTYHYRIPNRKFEAPVRKGEQIGTLEIRINQQVYQRFPICAKEDVKRMDYMFILRKFIRFLV